MGNYKFIIRFIDIEDPLPAIETFNADIAKADEKGYWLSEIVPIQYKGSTTILVAIMNKRDPFLLE